ncbi:sulfur carrier protein ThiS [Gayadomonas joobiniege]|uniref:sulfur carrier protein ThiS n=1 Tax=Gayadomonas joobiniege TaxID=1234606 RepID=UPI00036DD42B|nr:sulfur carrier protein ThiS [Gayadomonas joobiniege]
MNIFINGNEYQPEQADSLAELLAERQPKTPYAVALNGNFVSRGAYANTPLKDGDCIEILTPVQGG